MKDTPVSVRGPRRRWSRGGRGVVVGVVGLVLTVALLAGAGALVRDPVLGAAGLLGDGGGSSVDPREMGPIEPAPTPAAAPSPPAVLPPAEAGEPASGAPLVERVDEVDRVGVGGRFDLRVDDAITGEVLLEEGTDRASIPASVQKILTGATALRTLGPDRTFPTTVERRGGVWVLVGGGDPLLTGSISTDYPSRGSLQQLAEQTASAAADADLTTIDLAADADLFGGPDWSPDWPENYRQQVTPVSALVHDQGRTAGVTPGPREDDPARAALERFAVLLQDEGVDVGDVTEDGPGGSGELVAEVSSPPVGVLVERMLQSSDNDIAENLFRHAALAAGQPGTFEGGAQAADAVLADLGVDRAGMAVRDGSGLSRENRLAAPTLSELVGLALRAEDVPELAPLLTGLPLAGGTGSLASRFTAPGTAGGRGEVRAKTGSLRETRSLAGYTRTADGRLLSFAFLVDGAEDDLAAQVWLDRAATAVSSCGC